MEYPCNCEDMRWMIDNNKVFKKDEDIWVLSWIELDKTNSGVNVTPLGVKFKYCLFCGKGIKK